MLSFQKPGETARESAQSRHQHAVDDVNVTVRLFDVGLRDETAAALRAIGAPTGRDSGY